MSLLAHHIPTDASFPLPRNLSRIPIRKTVHGLWTFQRDLEQVLVESLVVVSFELGFFAGGFRGVA